MGRPRNPNAPTAMFDKLKQLGLVNKFKRDSQCYSKKQKKKTAYHSEQHAEQARVAMEAREGKRFSAYRCPCCKQWHVGHKN